MNIRSRLSMLGMVSLVSLGVISIATSNVFSATPNAEEAEEQPPVSNAVPADTWWEDNGTSIYNFNSGNVGIGDTTPAAKFVVGNGDKFRVTAGGLVRSVNGSSATPTYSFSSDTNTGIFQGAADVLQFATGGVTRLTLTQNGSVGIGNSSPQSLLTVGSNGLFQVTDAGDVVANSLNVNGARVSATGQFLASVQQNAGPDVHEPRFSFEGTSAGMDYSAAGQELQLMSAGGIGLYLQPEGSVVIPGNLGIGSAGTDRLAIDNGGIGLRNMGYLRFDGNEGKINFGDNGEISSKDENHRILFRRTDNKLELREYGDIIFSSGAEAGVETVKVTVQANGNLKINRNITADGDICIGSGC